MQPLRNINGIDLVASEAVYHRPCRSMYTSQRNLTFQNYKESSPFETVYDTCFQELMSVIEPGIKAGTVYLMSDLMKTYKEKLSLKGVLTADGYRSDRFKQRLHSFFKNQITIHEQLDHSKDELIYSSVISVQNVVQNVAQSYSGSEEFSLSSVQGITGAGDFKDNMENIRVLQHAADIIKAEIKDCKGICVKPIDMKDLTFSSCKSIIPDSLYQLLRCIISNDQVLEVSPPECRNKADERKIVMIAQDIVHCATHSHIKMPKHVSLAMSVRHLTGSKQLISMLSRMGHCVSYDDVEAMDTSLAKEILAKSEICGVVVPSNIVPGVFVQVAADNNDITEETLDGKNTTHATTMILFQRGQYGPAPTRTLYANHANRDRSIRSNQRCQALREFSAQGKRPAVLGYTGKMKEDWYVSNRELHSTAYLMDQAWSLVRLTPSTLFEVELSLTCSEHQVIPNWTAFNAIVNSSLPTITNIGYCPLLDGSPTEFNTVYTLMQKAKTMMISLGQEDSVITFDLAIYVKAKEIQ